MKRWLWLVAGLGLLATACQIQPLEDPGLGDRGLTSVVYASDGSVLAEWHAEEDRALVTYEELPRHLIDAVVAIEDERYWATPGSICRRWPGPSSPTSKPARLPRAGRPSPSSTSRTSC